MKPQQLNSNIYTEAEPLSVWALSIREQQLGPQHAYTTQHSRSNYASFLREKGREGD